MTMFGPPAQPTPHCPTPSSFVIRALPNLSLHYYISAWSEKCSTSGRITRDHGPVSSQLVQCRGRFFSPQDCAQSSGGVALRPCPPTSPSATDRIGIRCKKRYHNKSTGSRSQIAHHTLGLELAMADQALSLVCTDCNAQLRSVKEAQDHGERLVSMNTVQIGAQVSESESLANNS